MAISLLNNVRAGSMMEHFCQSVIGQIGAMAYATLPWKPHRSVVFSAATTDPKNVLSNGMPDPTKVMTVISFFRLSDDSLVGIHLVSSMVFEVNRIVVSRPFLHMANAFEAMLTNAMVVMPMCDSEEEFAKEAVQPKDLPYAMVAEIEFAEMPNVVGLINMFNPAMQQAIMKKMHDEGTLAAAGYVLADFATVNEGL